MNVPILSSKFFDNHTPDLGFFTKWRSLYPWNDQLMPIYEWQDVLYVGCTGIPSTPPKTQQKIVFLLCDPEQLKRVWYNFEGTVVVSRTQTATASTKIKPHIPEPSLHAEPILNLDLDRDMLDLNQQNSTEALDTNQESPIESLELNLPTEAAQELELPELEISYPSPDTFNLGTSESVQEIQPAAIHAEEKTAKQEEPPLDDEVTVSINIDTPELSAAIAEPSMPPVTSPNVQPSASPQPVVLDPMEALMALHGGGESNAVAPKEDSEEIPEQHNEGEPELNKESEEVLDLLDLGGSAPAPSLQSNEPSPPPAVAATLEPLQTLTPSEPPAAAASTLAPTTSATTPIAPATTAAATHTPTTKSQLKSPPLEAWAEKVISEIKLEFDKVMIFLRTGDQVKPWRWDEDFKSSSPTLATFSLIPASPFRIVNRTHKSYHGYVVTNDFNQKFFAQWNDNEVPEHLTIAPILNQDVVVGMILAIGKKSADTKGCLQLVEDKAATLASHITATPSAA